MIYDTRLRLTEWRRYVLGSLPWLGYPRAAAFAMAGTGARGDATAPMPEHIERIDRIVCTAPADYRAVIWCWYLRDGTRGEKARWLGLSRWRMRRRLEAAERYVDQCLGIEHGAYGNSLWG